MSAQRGRAAQPFRPGSPHVVAAEHVEHRVALVEHEVGRTHEHQRDRRQDEVVVHITASKSSSH